TPQIKLPQDSIVRKSLLSSLELFLQEKNNNLPQSTVVEAEHYVKYKDFFDIFNKIENSKRYNDTAFFKCHLTNVVLQPDKSWKITLTYAGISPEKQIIQRLIVHLLAQPYQDKFRFYCPFEQNTRHWTSQRIGNIEFYYKNDFNRATALDFDRYNTTLANRLGTDPLQFKYYKCQDIQEVYQLMGIDYDLLRNGEVRSGSFDAKKGLFLSGTNSDQYKHDLTHGYFDVLLPDSLRNWTAEEGYNIVQTDYWGESSKQVFQYLRDYAKNNPQTSLLEVFEKNITLKYPIPIKYPISAVIMRKIEREHGFAKVMQLISCGESDDRFFEVLKQVAGITKTNFDQTVRGELKAFD
ncbi:MAG: hypothetical protein IT269_11010, partial [Saprospiraceae bacterium]|nr:hypothetical protein [Saprospiraceae bacterium]